MFALKGPISFDRKALHPSVFKFNCAFIIFCAVWFIIAVPIMLTIGIIYDESFITYAVMIAGFAIFFIGFFVFFVISYKIRNKLIIENYATELEEEFADMPIEEAEKILKKYGIIDENGFLCKDVFGKSTIPFDDAIFLLNYKVSSTFITLYIQVIDSLNTNSSNRSCVITVDGAVFNFILKKYDYCNPVFSLLRDNKKEFAETFFKGGEKLQQLLR